MSCAAAGWARRGRQLEDYAHKTVAVDASFWLHKGAYGCALALLQGDASGDSYVTYAMNLVYMLRSKNVTPLMVFDGRNLPSKAEESAKRAAMRNDSRARAIELLKAGKKHDAEAAYQKAISVTVEMTQQLIEACRQHGVDFVVSPYEADAQLAYLKLSGHVRADNVSHYNITNLY